MASEMYSCGSFLPNFDKNNHETLDYEHPSYFSESYQYRVFPLMC